MLLQIARRYLWNPKRCRSFCALSLAPLFTSQSASEQHSQLRSARVRTTSLHPLACKARGSVERSSWVNCPLPRQPGSRLESRRDTVKRINAEREKQKPKAARFAWKANALRHSFISYRLARIQRTMLCCAATRARHSVRRPPAIAPGWALWARDGGPLSLPCQRRFR